MEQVGLVITGLNRLYQFSAGIMPDEKPVLGQVFAAVGDPRDKFQEVPCSSPSSSSSVNAVARAAAAGLRLFRPAGSDVAGRPRFLTWSTDAGIFFAEVEQVLAGASGGGGDVLGPARLIPCPADCGKLLSVAVTEFHVIICAHDGVRGLSSLNDQLVFEDVIKLEVSLSSLPLCLEVSWRLDELRLEWDSLRKNLPVRLLIRHCVSAEKKVGVVSFL